MSNDRPSETAAGLRHEMARDIVVNVLGLIRPGELTTSRRIEIAKKAHAAVNAILESVNAEYELYE